MRLEMRSPIADDQVGDARGEFENRRQAAQNFIEGVELLVDKLTSAAIGESLTSAAAVSRWRARSRELMASAPVRSPCDGGRGGAQQLVGDLGHGADHHYGLLAQGHASGHDGRGAADGRRVLDRRAAKLHHYQAHANFPIV